LEPVLCRPALGKLPFVLTPFVNFAIDQTPETVAKLVPIAQQKLSPIHCFISDSPAGSTANSSPLAIRVPYPKLAQIFRIYPGIWMSVSTGARLQQLKRTKS